MRYSPYTKPLFDRLETTSLVTMLLIAVISMYNVGVASTELHPPDAMTGIEWAVTVALAVLNLGVLPVLTGLWPRLQCAHARVDMRASMARCRISGCRRRQLRQA